MEKQRQIHVYSELLAEVRAAIAPDKIVSAAISGPRRYMIAIEKHTAPSVCASVDFFNVMTDDLVNRRATIINHPAGFEISLDAINAYEERDILSRR